MDHVRTRVPTPGQNGVPERAFQSLKDERHYREQIDDMHDLVAHGEECHTKFNTVRPHEALSWNRPSRCAPAPSRPLLTHLSRARKPAKNLTRDTCMAAPRWVG
ncbi:integrase core domain-containing protein [Ornithinimicrobium sp. W1665]|uniref:integrase core domain-containing protein n=1 Tax=Ornithinimicrobium sp. W1665 TaxID=3416666 RepID=UPI003CE9D53B